MEREGKGRRERERKRGEGKRIESSFRLNRAASCLMPALHPCLLWELVFLLQCSLSNIVHCPFSGWMT